MVMIILSVCFKYIMLEKDSIYMNIFIVMDFDKEVMWFDNFICIRIVRIFVIDLKM